MKISTHLSQTVPVDGLQIHYLEQNNRSRQSIIFIHGRGMSSNCWSKQLDAAELMNCRIIAMDLPGHGASSWTNDQRIYSLAGFSDILKKFIETLGLQNFILAGVSLGGHIALQALPDLPTCSGVLALTTPITKPINMAAMYLNHQILADAFSDKASAIGLEDYYKILFDENFDVIPDWIKSDYALTDPRIHSRITEGVDDGDYLDEVRIIQSDSRPIVVAAGAGERVHNIHYLNSINLPGYTLKLIPNAGHLPQWEAPDFVNGILIDLVSRNVST